MRKTNETPIDPDQELVRDGMVVQIDDYCEEADHVEVEVQERPNGHVLYVHVNGITVLRICRISHDMLKVTLDGEQVRP